MGAQRLLTCPTRARHQLSAELGASVIAVEYPGYGVNESQRQCNESGVLREVHRVYTYMTTVAGCVVAPAAAALLQYPATVYLHAPCPHTSVCVQLCAA